MFCPSCGGPTPDNAQFCASCGAYLISPVASGQAVAMGARPLVPDESVGPGSRLYAGFWMRFLACLIDGFILQMAQLILVLPILLVPGVFSAAGPRSARGAIGVMIFVLVAVTSLLIQWVYEAGFTSSARQATPGKMALGLVVTDESGTRISFARATGRFFAKLVSSMTFLIGYLIQPFTRRRQALHDMLAGTLVLRS